MRTLALAASLVLAGTAACGRSSAAPAAPAAQARAEGGRRLLFFMNPNGQPCQEQDRILRAMPDLAARAEVVYLRTTEPAHLQVFERFGVRALPTLVVVDGAGRELRRGTPGIQPDASVRSLLAP